MRARASLVLAALLFATALAMRLPLLDAPAYGDEHQHVLVAAHPGDPSPHVTDMWGNPVGIASHLAWQRPAYYAALHGPALLGLDAVRAVHLVLAALLPVAAFACLRVHGASRAGATVAGLAIAVTPGLVVWGAYALMDTPATLLLLVLLVARRLQRHGWVAILGTLAVWTKETMWAAVVVLFLLAFVPALRAGRASLDPLRLDPASNALAWPLVLGPMPIAVAFALGLPGAGGAAYGSHLDVLPLVLPTAFLVPLLALGLLWPRSRFLAAAGLAAPAAFAALHVAGRSVEAWYAVPALALTLVGAAAAGDEAVRRLRRPARPGPAPGRLVPAAGALLALLALAAVAGAALLPDDGARDAAQMLPGPAPVRLQDALAHETQVRDQDLVAALAAVPWEQQPRVFVVQDAWPFPFLDLQRADRVIIDLPFLHDLHALDTNATARHLEDPATWTVMGPGERPLQAAMREVYADCIVARHGGHTVLHNGGTCTGRAAAVDAAYHRLGGL